MASPYLDAVATADQSEGCALRSESRSVERPHGGSMAGKVPEVLGCHILTGNDLNVNSLSTDACGAAGLR